MHNFILFTLTVTLLINRSYAQAPKEPDEQFYTDERPALILTTDFIIPMVRYDLLEKRDAVSPKGVVSAFNSLGAGLSFAFGSLTTRFTDSLYKQIDKKNAFDFKNVIALQAGVLFSITQTESESTNIFAPCVGLSALDLSLMWGYDLGNTDTNLDGHFFTIAYNVPLRKILSKALFPVNRFRTRDERLNDVSKDSIKSRGMRLGY